MLQNMKETNASILYAISCQQRYGGGGHTQCPSSEFQVRDSRNK